MKPQVVIRPDRERRLVYQFKLIHIIYYIAGAIEVLLGFRFTFHIFGANPSAGLVMFVDNVSAPLMAPFKTIFPNSSFGTGVFEWPVLVAMVVYLIVAFGIAELVNVIIARNRKEEIY
jgi:hypothetical protein